MSSKHESGGRAGFGDKVRSSRGVHAPPPSGDTSVYSTDALYQQRPPGLVTQPPFLSLFPHRHKMRFSLLVSSSIALLASFVAADASDVVSLTSENFDAVVKPEALILVEFFAPWYENFGEWGV